MDGGLSAPKAAAAAGVSDVTTWRVGTGYQEGGIAFAIYDRPRPGAVRVLDTRQEADVVAVAYSKAPDGARMEDVLEV